RPQECADCQQADKEDDLGLERLDQLVEPGPAEGLFLGRGDAVAFGAWQSARVAAGDRAEVDLAVEVFARDAPLLQPVAQLLTRGTGEGAVVQRGPQAWGLADQQNARQRSIGFGVARDRDRFSLVKQPGVVALAASPDAAVEGAECAETAP